MLHGPEGSAVVSLNINILLQKLCSDLSHIQVCTPAWLKGSGVQKAQILI